MIRDYRSCILQDFFAECNGLLRNTTISDAPDSDDGYGIHRKCRTDIISVTVAVTVTLSHACPSSGIALTNLC